MTISFNCPKCNALIAFDARHAGKRAHCQSCGQRFYIPLKSGDKPLEIHLKAEKGEPIPGFYRALFIKSWRIFADRDSVTPLVFVTAAVCFKFFLGNAICCMNYVTYTVVWGWLLGFYLSIIYETAFDVDTLPQVYLGEGVTFLWRVIEPFLIFFITMTVVQMPFIIALIFLQDRGLTFSNMWEEHTGYYLLLQALFLFGLALFPIAVLTTAVGRDVTLLRIDYLIVSVKRLLAPYITAVAVLTTAVLLETRTHQYSGASIAVTAANLALNLAVQVLLIVAMRGIGLLYRHYSCMMPW